MANRLLVVDNEPKLLRAVAVDLRGEGYDVTTARSGNEALISVAQKTPDLIVSDIRMPGMDGYELARRLRRNQRTALVPIVFLTAKDATADRIEGFRTGIDAYLTKPFSRTNCSPLSLRFSIASSARTRKLPVSSARRKPKNPRKIFLTNN